MGSRIILVLRASCVWNEKTNEIKTYQEAFGHSVLEKGVLSQLMAWERKKEMPQIITKTRLYPAGARDQQTLMDDNREYF